MATKAVVIFPYSGYQSGDAREKVFWRIVQTAKDVTREIPIIVLNRDTQRRGYAKAFLDSVESKSKPKVNIHHTWSVDTCQMWLSGWGEVLDSDDIKDNDRIVQLPGDIDLVADQLGNKGRFFDELATFIDLRSWDFIIGDFDSGDMFDAKELIDWYGTYALMANWFPEIAQRIRKLPLNRPRSEFLNIQVGVLCNLLTYRKFAYEQTLNMLIRSWNGEDKEWEYSIKSQKLGTLKDDSSFRQYRDCLDQIERTERMIKLLWREMNDKTLQDKPQEFIDQYDRLERRSTSIRDTARIIIRNILTVSQQP